MNYSEHYCKVINETVERKVTYIHNMHNLYDWVKIYTETVNRLFNRTRSLTLTMFIVFRSKSTCTREVNVLIDIITSLEIYWLGSYGWMDTRHTSLSYYHETSFQTDYGLGGWLPYYQWTGNTTYSTLMCLRLTFKCSNVEIEYWNHEVLTEHTSLPGVLWGKSKQLLITRWVRLAVDRHMDTQTHNTKPVIPSRCLVEIFAQGP